MLSKYEEIAEDLERRIRIGEYQDKLPSEKVLASEYGVTHVTAANALNRLRGRNIVMRARGRGTFVNPLFGKDTEVLVDFDVEGIFAEVFDVVKERYPHMRVALSSGDSKYMRVKSCDLSKQVTSLSTPYERVFSPLSEPLVSESLKDERFFTEAFDIHRGDSLYYGVPLIFSPFLLRCNKTLLREELSLDELPRPLTLKTLLELEKALSGKGKYCASSERYHFSTALCHACPRRFRDDGVDGAFGASAGVVQGLEGLERLFRRGIDSGARFKDGDVLFTYVCRQGIWGSERKREIDFEWDLLPLPDDLGGIKPVASESILVSNSSDDKAFLQELAFDFLRPDVQAVFAGAKYGVPVLKHLAFDSFDGANYRDDFFMSEIKKCVFRHDALVHPFRALFMIATKKYFSNECSFEDYRDEAVDLFRESQRNWDVEKLAMELAIG